MIVLIELGVFYYLEKIELFVWRDDAIRSIFGICYFIYLLLPFHLIENKLWVLLFPFEIQYTFEIFYMISNKNRNKNDKVDQF